MNKNLYKKKLFDQISLSNRCKSIILGSILGDGSLKISNGDKNAHLSIRHSIIQKEYLLWKIDQLTEINILKSLQVHTNQKLLYLSQSHQELTKLHHLTYKKNKLNIKRKWLNNLTPLSLAIWWCDDGSLIGNKKKGVLCTDGFDEKSVILLSRYLNNVWKIKSRVGNVKKNWKGQVKYYPRIWISTNELKKFIDVIKDFVPDCMKYKIDLL